MKCCQGGWGGGKESCIVSMHVCHRLSLHGFFACLCTLIFWIVQEASWKSNPVCDEGSSHGCHFKLVLGHSSKLLPTRNGIGAPEVSKPLAQLCLFSPSGQHSCGVGSSSRPAHDPWRCEAQRDCISYSRVPRS